MDKDDCDSNFDTKTFCDKVTAFCLTEGYDLVWFHRDIEEVYWGKQVSSHQKLNEAKNFRAKSVVGTIAKRRLNNPNALLKTSNVLCVLDKYLDKKER